MAAISASASSSHQWKFNASQRELDDSGSIRKSIDSAGNSRGNAASSSSRSIMGPARPMMGPSRPGTSAVESLQLSREEQESSRKSARYGAQEERARSNRDNRNEEKDDRSTGRDRMVEKRREGNADKRDYAQSREGGGMMEISDDILMGGSSSSWQAMKDARDGVGRAPNRRVRAEEERKAVMSDKGREYRAKEDSTMAMFKALAAERFGK